MNHKLYKSFFVIFSIFSGLLTPFFIVHAAGALTIQSFSPSGGTVSINSPVTFSVIPSGFSSPAYFVVDDVGTNLTGYLNSAGNFSWTPVARDVGGRTLTITATDSAGNTATANQSFTVIVPSVSLTSMTNAPTAFVGTPVSFQVTPVGFTNPSYWIGDSMGGSTLTNSKLNSTGAFFWVPTFSDIGTHKVIVNVSDQFSHFAQLIQDITVATAPKPEVQSLTPGTTTPVGGAVSFSVTSPGLTSPVFTVSDGYSPSTVTSANMTASGVFTWTPTASQVGTHNIRTQITSSDGRTAEVYQAITVEAPSIAIEGYKGDGTVRVGETVTFMLTSKGLSSPAFKTSSNYPGGSTIVPESVSTSGLFVWMPTMADIGMHNISINAVDTYGNYAVVRKDIKVLPAVVVSSATPAQLLVTNGTQAAQVSDPNTSTEKPLGYMFTKSLSIGSAGQDVLALQEVLQKGGFFSVSPNGTYGPMTVAAVKKFQIAYGLSPVGFVGPGTRAKLNSLSGSTGVSSATAVKYRFTLPLALGSKGTEVSELQKRLVSLGFYFGIPTGMFDTATVEAVKKFQASKGLEQVGSVGPGTRTALNSL